MKKSLLKPIAALMAVLMLFGFPMAASANKVDASAYTDLEKTWYYNDVVGAVQAGLFQGTSPTTFNPKGQITRSEFVTALGRLCKADFSAYQAPSSLTDVKPGQWFFEEVGWAYAAGVTEGSSPTTFSPNKRITRQEMAKMLAGAVEKVYGRKLKTDGAKTFADQASIAGWAAEWVAKCSANGLLKGDEKGNFNPKNTASRAEAAVLFYRCYKMLNPEPPATEPSNPSSGITLPDISFE